MFKDTFNELGIVSKTNGCIHNYHTWHDMPERFELETVGDGFDVILGVIDKIDKFQKANGFNGPQK